MNQVVCKHVDVTTGDGRLFRLLLLCFVNRIEHGISYFAVKKLIKPTCMCDTVRLEDYLACVVSDVARLYILKS